MNNTIINVIKILFKTRKIDFDFTNLIYRKIFIKQNRQLKKLPVLF